MKQCSKCKIVKLLSEFFKDKHQRDGHCCRCKECYKKYEMANKVKRNMYLKSYREENKEKIFNYRRKRDLKKYFNLTDVQYDEKFKLQDGKCAICKTKQQEQLLSVDHNHETLEIRDLLCKSCNLALGNINENLETAKSLVKYIKRWNNG